MARLEAGPAFDVVLCDLVMPGASGADFLRLVRERFPSLDGRLLFMTGGATSEATAQLAAVEEHRVLYKPLEGDALREAIALAGRPRSPSTGGQ